MTPDPTPGLLLAGGLARRMGGGDKPMKTIGGRTILTRVIARLGSQCDGLILNANGDPQRFAAFGLPVVADTVDGFRRPVGRNPRRPRLDRRPSPRRYLDVERRRRLPVPAARSGDATASSAHRAEYENRHRCLGRPDASVIGLWSVALRDDLRHALVVENFHAVGRWTARYDPAIVSWPLEPLDPFFNANTVDDIAEAERLAALDDD